MTTQPTTTRPTTETPLTGRVQLALDVPDLEAAVDFYSRLFGTAPHKRRPGYANFAVASPPLKLVLMEAPDRPSGLNHVGVERPDTAAVHGEAARLLEAGLSVREGDGVVCCHAQQDKHWVVDPGGLEWENYTVTDDDPDRPSPS